MDDDGVDLSPQQVFDAAQLGLQQAVFPLLNKRNGIKSAARLRKQSVLALVWCGQQPEARVPPQAPPLSHIGGTFAVAFSKM